MHPPLDATTFPPCSSDSNSYRLLQGQTDNKLRYPTDCPLYDCFFQPILPPPTAAITTAQGRIRTDGPQQPGFLGKSSKIAEENNSVEELGQVIFLAASPLSATDRKERSRRAATGAEKATKLYTRRRRPSWLCWSMNLAAAAGRNGVWKLGNESRMVAACSRRARDRRHDRDSRQKKTQGRPMLYHSST